MDKSDGLVSLSRVVGQARKVTDSSSLAQNFEGPEMSMVLGLAVVELRLVQTLWRKFLSGRWSPKMNPGTSMLPLIAADGQVALPDSSSARELIQSQGCIPLVSAAQVPYAKRGQHAHVIKALLNLASFKLGLDVLFLWHGILAACLAWQVGTIVGILGILPCLLFRYLGNLVADKTKAGRTLCERYRSVMAHVPYPFGPNQKVSPARYSNGEWLMLTALNSILCRPRAVQVCLAIFTLFGILALTLGSLMSFMGICTVTILTWAASYEGILESDELSEKSLKEIDLGLQALERSDYIDRWVSSLRPLDRFGGQYVIEYLNLVRSLGLNPNEDVDLATIIFKVTQGRL